MYKSKIQLAILVSYSTCMQKKAVNSACQSCCKITKQTECHIIFTCTIRFRLQHWYQVCLQDHVSGNYAGMLLYVCLLFSITLKLYTKQCFHRHSYLQLILFWFPYTCSSALHVMQFPTNLTVLETQSLFLVITF